MEKKRSPRSPAATIFPKSPLVFENYKSGCGWKLINFFDFRHVQSGNKRLSSEKRFTRDSAGNVYTKSQVDLLKRLHENCQCNDESKPVQGLLEKEIRRINNLKEETQKTNDKEKQIDLKNGRNCKKSAEINLQTLICSKAEEKGKDRSKQFMEALDILSSNKDLFTTLLQDPNSFSAKKGQDLERSKTADLDNVVFVKPRLTSSSVDDGIYLRFKHLAKKLKLVVGTNKQRNHSECSGKARETEAARTGDVSTSIIEHKSPESPVFRRKKRVESDVFKPSSIENSVLPRRFMVERQHERSNSSPVYEVPYALSSLQTKLKERRQKLEKIRESFNLWSLDNSLEVFDPNPPNFTDSAEYRSLRTHVDQRYLESSLAEPNSREINVHDQKQEQEQPSPVSVLERIHLEDESVSPRNVKIYKLEGQIGLSFDDPNMELVGKDSIHEFVKKVLEASRLNWSNLLARCCEETSLLDEFSHGNHNNDRHLLVLDYTDEILREIYRQDIKFRPFTPLTTSRVVNLQYSLRKEDLVQETLRCFDWSLLCGDSPSRTLDQIIETDLIKQCLWLDFGGESESVVSDVVEKILQQMVLEISHELRTMRKRICGLI